MGHLHAADGTIVEYDATGSGPLVVLVHGITEDRRSWDPIVDRLLLRGRRVLAVDLRGHGGSSVGPEHSLGSMASDLGAVIADAGAAEPPLLVGHSLGGAVVSAYAGSGGGSRGVVNVDQPLALGGFRDGLLQIEGALRGDDEAFRGAVGAVFEQMAGPLPAAERDRIEAIRSPKQQVVLDVWDLVLRSSVDELDATVAGLAAGIKVPYLSLHGIDPGDGYADWLGGLVERATVEVWPDHGHYPHLVDPERFVDRVIAFDPLGNPG